LELSRRVEAAVVRAVRAHLSVRKDASSAQVGHQKVNAADLQITAEDGSDLGSVSLIDILRSFVS
jgi:hypothetical protein